MSEPVHLVCGHCDAVVRVPPERFPEGPRCPTCHNPLFEDHSLELKSASFAKVNSDEEPTVASRWAFAAFRR